MAVERQIHTCHRLKLQNKDYRISKILTFGMQSTFCSVLSFMQVFYGKTVKDLFIWCHYLSVIAPVPVLLMSPFWVIFVKIKSSSTWYLKITEIALILAERTAAAAQDSCLPAHGAEAEKGLTSFYLRGSLFVCTWASAGGVKSQGICQDVLLNVLCFSKVQ